MHTFPMIYRGKPKLTSIILKNYKPSDLALEGITI
jgi:hypothetical protein